MMPCWRSTASARLPAMRRASLRRHRSPRPLRRWRRQPRRPPARPRCPAACRMTPCSASTWPRRRLTRPSPARLPASPPRALRPYRCRLRTASWTATPVLSWSAASPSQITGTVCGRAFRNLANGVLLGAGAPISAATAAVREKLTNGGDLASLYAQARSAYGGAQDQYRQQNPGTALATELAGSLPTTIGATMAGGAALGMGGNALLDAVAGSRAAAPLTAAGQFVTGGPGRAAASWLGLDLRLSRVVAPVPWAARSIRASPAGTWWATQPSAQ